MKWTRGYQRSHPIPSASSVGMNKRDTHDLSLDIKNKLSKYIQQTTGNTSIFLCK